MSHMDRLEMHSRLLHIINIAMKNLISVATLLVAYQEYTQIMFQNLQNIQHDNTIFKTDLFPMTVLEYLFLLVILVVKTVRV